MANQMLFERVDGKPSTLHRYLDTKAVSMVGV